MKDDLQLLFRALEFAAYKHREQRRSDADCTPYINHPIALARVLVEEGGVTDAVVLAAAILHDTIEDTETTYEELVAGFGDAIAGVVREVTDDKSLPKQVRKDRQVEQANKLSLKAKLVKLADKTCNLRDIANSPPIGWSAERKADYYVWASKVVSAMGPVDSPMTTVFQAARTAGPA